MLKISLHGNTAFAWTQTTIVANSSDVYWHHMEPSMHARQPYVQLQYRNDVRKWKYADVGNDVKGHPLCELRKFGNDFFFKLFSALVLSA